MREFIIGFGTEEQQRVGMPFFQHLEFVVLKVCPPQWFAVETECDLEIVPVLFHEVVGGRPQKGVAQILPTYRIRYMAPWVAVLPPLEYEWGIEYDEEGTAELLPFRHGSHEADIQYMFDTVLVRIKEFDRQYPGRLKKIGFHVQTILGDQVDEAAMRTIAKVLSTHAELFEPSSEVSDMPSSPLAQAAEIRNWLKRYDVGMILFPEGAKWAPASATAYSFSEVFVIGSWIVVELHAMDERVSLLIGGNFQVDSAFVQHQNQIAVALDISEYDVACIVKSHSRDSRFETTVCSSGRLRLICGNAP